MKTIPEYAVILRDAIIKLASKAHPAAVPVLEKYLRLVNPSLSRKEDSDFPFAVVPHRFKRDRSSTLSKYGVLYFTIGAAILAYYDCVNAGMLGDNLKDRVDGLQVIASDGFENFIVAGSVMTGFYLTKRA